MAAVVDMSRLDEKVLLFLKNTIHQFYDICGGAGGGQVEYKHRRLVFLRNIVLEFENILDGMGKLGVEALYRTWLSSCIIHIRDLRFGYGIRDIAYALLVVWYRRFPDEADLIIRRFVSDIGCWSDIKRFLGLWRELGGECSESGVVGRVVNIMIDQLWLDYGVWNRVFGEYMEKRTNGEGPCSRPRALDYISNAAKWVVREKSKYGWLYDQFVIAWGTKAGWRRCGRGCMDRWRKDFRKVVSSLSRELYQDCELCDSRKDVGEAKDFVRMIWEGSQEFGYESGWRDILERFCSTCFLAKDTIPVVDVRYYDFGTDDFWRAISYAILIAQRGCIGRFMLATGGLSGVGSWIVCTSEHDIVDIISQIRWILGGGGQAICSGGYVFQGALDLIKEASEVSGYDVRDKVFYIGTNINV